MNKQRRLVDISLALYYKSQLRKDQWREPHQLKKIQFRNLKASIKHAYDYIPYYHRLFSNAKIKPEDIGNFDDMRKIPSTSKQDLRQNYPDMVASGVDTSRLASGATSGSTGVPLRVFRDYSFNRGNARASSIQSYILSECGVKSEDRFVTVWGRDSESIQWGKKHVRLWGGVNETTVPLFPPAKLANILRLIQPNVLNTFPSVFMTLTDYDISGIHPRMVLTQGEVVTQHCRDLVKKTFGLELFETYGCVEFGNLAFECNRHHGLHMITDKALIEFVDETGEYSSFGEQGEIIVTGFWNRVMPLIRYRIGDLGIQTDEKCACGRSWPLIKGIQGRIDDYLVSPSGRRISWIYFIRAIYNVFFRGNVFAISQYQIVQDQKGKAVFKIVKGRDFTPKMLERIERSLKKEFDKLGENLEITTQIVDDIPRELTGKRRTLISKVPQ